MVDSLHLLASDDADEFCVCLVDPTGVVPGRGDGARGRARVHGTVETFIEMGSDHPTLGETFKYAAYDMLALLGPA